jgi:hypothetical protein
MLEALGWNIYKINNKKPEIHEKAFGKKLDVGKGLPDIKLKNENGTTYIRVKIPPLGLLRNYKSRKK